LKQHDDFINRNDKRARVSALVCLCLMLHALFVCLTHHHDTAPLSPAAVIAASDSDSHTTRDTGSDAGCLSCRLQRTFVADSHISAFTPEPAPQALLRETRLAQAHTRRRVTSLFGRAPPLV
jgi:hypothetical protein